MKIRHLVTCGRPERHHFHVESRFDDVPGSEATLVLPVWTPGSYMVRDFSRHLFDVVAAGPGGATIRCRKVRKNAWRVAHDGKPFTIRFRAFALDPTVRTAFLDADRGWFNGANLLLYVEGRADAGASVEVRAPRGWKVATSMPPAKGRRGTYVAADYDELLDHPFLLGRLRTIRFRAARKIHRFVLNGVGEFPEKTIVDAARRSIEQASRLFGGLPYRDYSFFLNFGTDGEGQGGLEHRASSLLQAPARALLDPAKRRAFFGLVAHEHFHLWNVKRIRDRVLGPFDYERENYTELLWFHEGFTSYYDDLLPARGGVFTVPEYLDLLGETLSLYFQTPGRLRQPLVEASFDAWIKFYKRNEEARSVTVNYYAHGALMALAFDLLVRRDTRGRKSLDDVLRALWADARRGGAIDAARWLDLAREATGRDLRDPYSRWIAGVEAPPFAALLRTVGLRLEPKRAEDARTPWPGWVVRSEGGRAVVEEVLHGGPAYEAGVQPRDELIALDSRRIGADVDAALQGVPATAMIRLDVFRSDRLRRLRVRLRPNPNPAVRLVPRPRATPGERRRFKAWCGRAFPG
jgi:predicted metalloprotease with PDZ domain